MFAEHGDLVSIQLSLNKATTPDHVWGLGVCSPIPLMMEEVESGVTECMMPGVQAIQESNLANNPG